MSMRETTVKCPHCGEKVPFGPFSTTCRRCLRSLEQRPEPERQQQEAEPRLPSPTSQSVPTHSGEREVPWAVGVRVIYGNLWSLLGWIFLMIAVPGACICVFFSDVSSYFEFRGPIAEAQAHVLSVDRTSSHENNSTILRYDFEFTADGRPMTRRSYSPGAPLQPGQVVTVEYPEGRPELARIKGMRRRPMPAWLVLVACPHLILGVVFACLGRRQGRRATHLLKHGATARAELLSKRRTLARVNNKPVYRFEFRFEDSSGNSHTIVAKTHRTELVEDEERELVLYDPERPERAVVVDTLPGPPSIDSLDRVEPGSAGVPVATLIPALLTAIGVLVCTVVLATQ